MYEKALIVAEWLAEGAVAHIGGAIVEQQLNDLGIKESLKNCVKDIIEDAVQRICNFIHEEFIEQNISNAISDMHNALNQLSLI